MRVFPGQLIDYLKNIYRNARGLDHKLLTQYLLTINQIQDIDGLVNHSAHCIHNLLRYRIFAFAMYDREFNGGLDVWVTPKADGPSLMKLIGKDFSFCNGHRNVHSLADGYLPDPSAGDDVSRIVALPVIDNQTIAMIYVLPPLRTHAYHREMLDVIVKTIGTAISNFINLKKLETAALIDPLTHCYNRRALDWHLEHDLGSHQRYGTDFSVVMIDIDHFKKINDTYSHSMGDAVLKAVAKSIMGRIRKSDYLARYGGEEFVLALPGTKLSKAIDLAERLRQVIENLKIRQGNQVVSVTASFGVASFKKGYDKAVLLQKADEMLYEAKRQGRNRTKPDLKVYYPKNSGQPSLDESLAH